MALDDEILIAFMSRVEGKLGAIEANQQNALEYVKSVSKSSKEHSEDKEAHGINAEKITDHMASEDAHGAGTGKGVRTRFIAWSGLGLAGLAALERWFHR